MQEIIKEYVQENIKHIQDIEAVAEQYYNDEINYNNADKTSGQKCYSYEQILDMVARAVLEVNK